MELFTTIGTYGVALLSLLFGGFATYAYMSYKRDIENVYRTISDNDSYQQRERGRFVEEFRNDLRELGRRIDEIYSDFED